MLRVFRRRSAQPGAESSAAPLSAGATPGPTHIRGDWLRSRGRSVASLAGVILLGAVIVGLHVRADPKLSPIDEAQHVDYVTKAGYLQLPRTGERYGPTARHEVACRTIEAAYVPPPCSLADSVSADLYPERGINTAAGDPPLYYLATGLAARALRATLHLDSVVTAARLLGAAWLAGALILLWLAMAELEIGVLARTAVGVLVVTTPVVIHSQATVTSDALLLLAGSSALYTILLWERHRIRGWVVVAVAMLCGLGKAPCLLAVAAVCGYLLVRSVRAAHGSAPGARSPQEAIRLSVATVAGGLLTTVAWIGVAHLRAIKGAPESPSAIAFHVQNLGVGKIVAQLGALLSPIADPPILTPLAHTATNQILIVTNAILLGAVLGGAALAAAGSRLEALTTSTAALMFVGGPAFVVAIFATQHQVLPDIPHRYGLALVPFAAAAVADLLGKPAVRYVVAALAAAVAVYTVARLAVA